MGRLTRKELLGLPDAEETSNQPAPVADKRGGRCLLPLALIFSALAAAWPFAALPYAPFAVLVMFDLPDSGPFLLWFALWSFFLYGPVYLAALAGSLIALTVRRNRALAQRLWVVLCGTNIGVLTLTVLLMVIL